MDIQKMVDERVEKLRAQMMKTTSSITDEADFHSSSETLFVGPPPNNDISAWNDVPLASPTPRSRIDLTELGDLVDASLVEVAERILSITERIADDYARIEKDILNSRLVVLQSAEEVLDIAISLRRKTKNIISSSDRVNVERPLRVYSGSPVIAGHDGEIQDRRVSMHELGVASLFRKT